MHAIKVAFQNVREQLTPVLQESAFLEKGVLTPEEFVRAGDHLVFHNPSWKWQTGEKTTEKDYLPYTKQYLVTIGVPCTVRANTLSCSVQAKDRRTSITGTNGDSEWIEAETTMTTNGTSSRNTVTKDYPNEEDDGGITDLTTGGTTHTNSSSLILPSSHPEPPNTMINKDNDNDQDDDYGDLSSFIDQTLSIPIDPKVIPPSLPIDPRTSSISRNTTFSSSSAPSYSFSSTIIPTRTYDISITYDRYYQTPRVFLKGYNEQKIPLSSDEMMEDIYQDYAQRTATIESHPLLPSAGPHISIHPCRHAAAMKRILDNLLGGTNTGHNRTLSTTTSTSNHNNASSSTTGDTIQRTDAPKVELYIFIFLKFLQTIIPTINYDFTTGVKIGI